MLVAVLLFILGLVMLIFGGDWFVDGAVGIARRLKMSELIIGATVVAIGTTLPEVMVSVTAAFEGYSATAYGNAIGSVICNTALISAVTMAVRPSEVDKKTLRLPLAFFFGAAAVYAAVAYTSGSFSRLMGVGLLVVFVAYMFALIIASRRAGKKLEPHAEGDGAEPEEAPQGKAWKDIFLLVLGAGLIAGGAKLLVDNGTKIALGIGVPESVVALTFVALGTSLPELVTAITSLVKGHSALSLGNIIGANLFNIVLVSGAAMTVSPFTLPTEKLIGGMNASLAVDIPVMGAAMLIMALPALLRGKVSRWQGIILLCIYVGYCVFQFAL